MGPLVGGHQSAPCWAPETGRSPQSSGLIGGVWPRDMCPPPGPHHQMVSWLSYQTGQELPLTLLSKQNVGIASKKIQSLPLKLKDSHH